MRSMASYNPGGATRGRPRQLFPHRGRMCWHFSPTGAEYVGIPKSYEIDQIHKRKLRGKIPGADALRPCPMFSRLSLRRAAHEIQRRMRDLPKSRCLSRRPLFRRCVLFRFIASTSKGDEAIFPPTGAWLLFEGKLNN